MHGGYCMKEAAHRRGTMIKKMVLCLAAILVTGFWASTSFAAWSQEFYENGIFEGKDYNIVKIEIFDLGGTTDLNGNGLSNFSAGKWTVNKVTDNYVVAVNGNTNTSDFNWVLSLTGQRPKMDANLAYIVYTADGKAFGQFLNFKNNKWDTPMIANFNVNDPMFNRGGTAPVPIPPAALLLGTGLVSLVSLRKKLKA